MGARVLAVASGSDGVAMVRQLGAEGVIDGHEEDIAVAAKNFAPGGMDCVLLTTGGKPAEAAVQTLRDGGRAAYPNGVDPAPKAPDGTTIQAYDGMPTANSITRLNELINQGPFIVHVAKTFPLDEAGSAHQALNEHYLGKMALRPE
jgi:NADPH:quinone reductase-like Zn-dependent oxidoreductase